MSIIQFLIYFPKYLSLNSLVRVKLNILYPDQSGKDMNIHKNWKLMKHKHLQGF